MLGGRWLVRRWLRSSVGDHAVDKAFGADRPVLNCRNIASLTMSALSRA